MCIYVFVGYVAHVPSTCAQDIPMPMNVNGELKLCSTKRTDIKNKYENFYFLGVKLIIFCNFYNYAVMANFSRKMKQRATKIYFKKI